MARTIKEAIYIRVNNTHRPEEAELEVVKACDLSKYFLFKENHRTFIVIIILNQIYAGIKI